MTGQAIGVKCNNCAIVETSPMQEHTQRLGIWVGEHRQVGADKTVTLVSFRPSETPRGSDALLRVKYSHLRSTLTVQSPQNLPLTLV